MHALLVVERQRLHLAPQRQRVALAEQGKAQRLAIDAQAQGRGADDNMVGLFLDLVGYLRGRLAHDDGRRLVTRASQAGLAARLYAHHVHLRQADTQLHARVAAQVPAQRLAPGHVGRMHGAHAGQVADRRGMQAWHGQGGKGGDDTGGKGAAGKRERFHLSAFRSDSMKLL
ncbi:hypothetical protein D3C81_783110 [compost metagenome]